MLAYCLQCKPKPVPPPERGTRPQHAIDTVLTSPIELLLDLAIHVGLVAVQPLARGWKCRWSSIQKKFLGTSRLGTGAGTRYDPIVTYFSCRGRNPHVF